MIGCALSVVCASNMIVQFLIGLDATAITVRKIEYFLSAPVIPLAAKKRFNLLHTGPSPPFCCVIL